MHKPIYLLIFLFSYKATLAQFGFDKPPKKRADTLYFPFEEGIQLIIINHYDTWQNEVDFMEMSQPRGLSWASVMGPPPINNYIFRNKEGEFIKSYPAIKHNMQAFKSTKYSNASEINLNQIRDYNECIRHLKISENNKFGLINLKGEIVLPVMYDEIRKFQNEEGSGERLIIYQGFNFGLLDANLNIVFPPIYAASRDSSYRHYPEENFLHRNYLKMFKNNKCGVIDDHGKLFIDFIYDEIRIVHDTIYMCMLLKDENERKKWPNSSHWDTGYNINSCVLYDHNFQIIARMMDYDYIYYWGIKRFIVAKDKLFGVLDHKGKVIIPLEYDAISSKQGDFCVHKDNKYGMMNVDGKMVLPLEFKGLEFYDPAIYVTQDGLIGVYCNDYRLIAKPQFISKHWDMGKYVLTRADGTKGFVWHEKDASYYQSPEGERIDF